MIPKVRGPNRIRCPPKALVFPKEFFTCSEGRHFGQSYLTSLCLGFGTEKLVGIATLNFKIGLS
jgi:hypothetical protein